MENQLARKYGLNIGSGQRAFKDTPEVIWVNIDSQEKWMPDIVCNARLFVPLESECADYVVLHHVLEHFGCEEGHGLISEAHRLLKPGGSLFVSVPDIYQLAQRFLERKIDEYIFKVNIYGAYMGSEDDRHKWGYTWHSLRKEIMTAATWSKVDGFNNRKIPGMDFAADWWILAMEAIK